jgi:acyl-CoA synthetase (AMP-forming)/AMP-acid ligase II
MSSEHTSLAALIERGADSATAFVFDGTPISRGQFAQRVGQAAAWLDAHGIGRGDVIAVWLVNRLEWAALLFAAARLGAIVAAVNTRYRSTEVEHLLRLSGASRGAVSLDRFSGDSRRHRQGRRSRARTRGRGRRGRYRDPMAGGAVRCIRSGSSAGAAAP